MKKLAGPAIVSLPEETNKMYLTFDDGPTPEVTDQVLSTLEKFNAKGTFFCLGKHLQQHPKFISEFQSKGHKIGNHTFSHLNGWLTKNENYFNDIEKCQKHFQSSLFRPPYGKISPSQLSVLKKSYKVYLWDVLTADFDNSWSTEKSWEHILQFSKGGSILVFHDSEKAKSKMFDLLPMVLDYYSKRGFVFDVLPD